jgi:hypothetical protein
MRELLEAFRVNAYWNVENLSRFTLGLKTVVLKPYKKSNVSCFFNLKIYKMKNLLLFILLFIALSCSNDNCDAEIKSINNYYDAQIQQVLDNPTVSGIDYRFISLLEQERQSKLDNACK